MNFTREQIYQEWVGNVSGKHTLVGSLIIIATMSVFACLDFVAFEKALALHFATSRLVLIATTIIPEF